MLGLYLSHLLAFRMTSSARRLAKILIRGRANLLDAHRRGLGILEPLSPISWDSIHPSVAADLPLAASGKQQPSHANISHVRPF